MAQTGLKIKKTKTEQNKIKKSKVGLNKRKKNSNTPIEVAKRKVEQKIKANIQNKIESEMAMKVKNCNGKLSVLKPDTSKSSVTAPIDKKSIAKKKK